MQHGVCFMEPTVDQVYPGWQDRARADTAGPI